MTAELQRIRIYVKCDRKMDPARKNWNIRQKKLRTFLTNPVSYHQAIDLFLQQHAEVHSDTMSTIGTLSFEDEVINNMADNQLRCIPDQMDHSIVWILWHLARIEDVTMNMLVAGKKQMFDTGNWSSRLNIYWSKRTIAGLLLMPPTRHCFIHLNEALKIKKKVMK